MKSLQRCKWVRGLSNKRKTKTKRVIVRYFRWIDRFYNLLK